VTQAMGPLREAAALLHDARRVAVVAHLDPDADAVGSILGLAGGLRQLGKDVTVALSDHIPSYAEFLAGAGDIVYDWPEEKFDVYVLADAADIARVGRLYTEDPDRFRGTPILNMDHHGTNPGYGTVNLVVPDASSTSELSFRVLCEMGAPIDEGTATALLFGIVGDTGSFRNGATTASSLEVAAELFRRGADVQRIAYEQFERKRFDAARLFGDVLGTIRLDRERRIVSAWLSQEMMRETGATLDEIEGTAAYLRGVEEADVVMFLKETEDGQVKVSLRSKPGIDVSAIASALGGGGHRQAAGATLPGPRERAHDLLIETYDRLHGQ
jgi:bifunctional oligoribonuclease and PAP phosphatase NrnA